MPKVMPKKKYGNNTANPQNVVPVSANDSTHMAYQQRHEVMPVLDTINKGRAYSTTKQPEFEPQKTTVFEHGSASMNRTSSFGNANNKPLHPIVGPSAQFSGTSSDRPVTANPSANSDVINKANADAKATDPRVRAEQELQNKLSHDYTPANRLANNYSNSLTQSMQKGPSGP